jgi:hypothetical protein
MRYRALSITTLASSIKWHFLIVMLSVIMLSVIRLSVIRLSVIRLSVKCSYYTA